MWIINYFEDGVIAVDCDSHVYDNDVGIEYYDVKKTMGINLRLNKIWYDGAKEEFLVVEGHSKHGLKIKKTNNIQGAKKVMIGHLLEI